MKDCTNPTGHRWVATSFEIAAGSTPVRCDHCGATGFRLREGAGRPRQELAQRLGQERTSR